MTDKVTGSFLCACGRKAALVGNQIHYLREVEYIDWKHLSSKRRELFVNAFNAMNSKAG